MSGSFTQLSDRFLQMEIDNHLFDLSIKKHPFWEYVRYYVYEEIFRAKENVFFPTNKKSYFKKIKELLDYFFYRIKVFFKKNTKYDIILFTHDKTVVVDGKEVHFHAYPLVKALNKQYKILLVHPYDLPINKANYPCSILVTRPVYLLSRIKSFFYHFNFKDKKIFSHLQNIILNNFGIKIDFHQMAKYIFAWSLGYYKEYKRLFKAFKPKVCIFCHGGDMKPIIKAANHFDVKMIEYQHGIISPSEILYRYSNKVEIGKIKNTNPDYVFTFGDFWNDVLETPSKPVSVGFPHFDMGHENNENFKKNRNNILITSVLMSKPKLTQIALELADLLPDYNIYYKLRYNEYGTWKQNYPKNFSDKKNLIVIDNDTKSIYDYFSQCSFLISSNSMTLYEGLASGLTTIIVKDGAYEEMKPLFEKQYVFLATTSDEIADLIKNKQQPPQKIAVDHLFKTNSLLHIESFLKKEILF